MSDAKYPRAFADEATPFAEAARDESLARIQPESDRWPLAHGMRTALARLAWESGWDSALAASRRADSSTVLLPADTLAKVREALEMGAKLAQAQHVAKTYGACTDALSLLAAAQKQGEGVEKANSPSFSDPNQDEGEFG